jgi:hypothetical protein
MGNPIGVLMWSQESGVSAIPSYRRWFVSSRNILKPNSGPDFSRGLEEQRIQRGIKEKWWR